MGYTSSMEKNRDTKGYGDAGDADGAGYDGAGDADGAGYDGADGAGYDGADDAGYDGAGYGDAGYGDAGYDGADDTWADPTIKINAHISTRPQSFSTYIGQSHVVGNLKVYIEAARRREKPLDHTLFYGPPGLGKTTLANIIANEMGTTIRTTTGPTIEKQGDLAAILTNLNAGDILFIDEIHRLHPSVEELLYPAMEDYRLDIIIGQGPAARTVTMDLPPFTLIGATTRAGMLTSPLRDRFGIIMRLEYYSQEELATIVVNAAQSSPSVGTLDTDAASEIGSRSRGTPRIALRTLNRIRDFADVYNGGKITKAIAQEGMNRIGVDPIGLTTADVGYLRAMIEVYKGAPVGLETIASMLSEDRVTVEYVIEPYLIYLGFVHKTPRGRVATEQAYQHLGIPWTATPLRS